VRQWSDRKKVVYEPLFTSYVFVNVSDQELSSIKQTDGVINLVYWLNKPAVIRDAEIEAVKRFLNENENVKLERTPISINDNVRILGGPLMEYEGQVLSTKNKTLKIFLPSMGYLMYAEIESSNVEVITKTIPSIYTPLKMVK
jgi:transcription antitermination factor NusG